MEEPRGRVGMAFSGSGLDRSAHLRGDVGALERLLDQGGRILPIWRGKPLIHKDATLGWLEPGHLALASGKPTVFLGLDEGVARFACDVSDWSPEVGAEAVGTDFFDLSRQHPPNLPASFAFLELRSVMTALTPREGELAATAKAVLHWHRSHRFCSSCGAGSDAIQAGWQRECLSCGAHHFPRTDPVVIMLVTRGDRLLLGRSPVWPEGMYSCLAGFLEPGETPEDAVRREVAEETGVSIGDVRYVAAQPWPFPASLMMGFEAEALNDEISLDPMELEDARWMDLPELRSVMAGTHTTVRTARPGAIAHSLIADWIARRNAPTLL